jgi:hypothetical protein
MGIGTQDLGGVILQPEQYSPISPWARVRGRGPASISGFVSGPVWEDFRGGSLRKLSSTMEGLIRQNPIVPTAQTSQNSHP